MSALAIQEAALADLHPTDLVAPGAGPAWHASEPFLDRARWLVARQDGAPLARLSYETPSDLTGAPGLTGLVGRYDAASADAGVPLLREAARRLLEAGAGRVVGPMNGSTWARYRLVVDRGTPGAIEPPFPAEPTNPPEYPEHFCAAGFVVVAEFESRIQRDLTTPHPRAAERAERVAAAGVTVRPLDLAGFDRELESLHALSIAAFAANPWYAPIDQVAFHALYAPLRGVLDPDLVPLAHDRNGDLLGFALAFVDRPSAGGPGRVVLKTLATGPGARGLGLGTHLLDRVRAVAHDQGHAAVIHALMHAGNDSLKISRHTAEVFRRYALFGMQAPG